MDSLTWDTAAQPEPIFPPGTIFRFRDINLLCRNPPSTDSDGQVDGGAGPRRYWKVVGELGHGQVRVYKVIAVDAEDVDPKVRTAEATTTGDEIATVDRSAEVEKTTSPTGTIVKDKGKGRATEIVEKRKRTITSESEQGEFG